MEIEMTREDLLQAILQGYRACDEDHEPKAFSGTDFVQHVDTCVRQYEANPTADVVLERARDALGLVLSIERFPETSLESVVLTDKMRSQVALALGLVHARLQELEREPSPVGTLIEKWLPEMVDAVAWNEALNLAGMAGGVEAANELRIGVRRSPDNTPESADLGPCLGHACSCEHDPVDDGDGRVTHYIKRIGCGRN
jgi:hypothetical protein